MNILLVSNFYKPSWETGGVTKVTYDLAKNLVKKGHNVTVYTTDGFSSRLSVRKNVPLDIEGVKVYYFYNLSRYLVKNYKFPIPLYASHVLGKNIKNFDIVHIHEHRSFLSFFTTYYARKYHVPYVLQAHGSMPLTIGKAKLKFLYDITTGNKILRNASKIIAVSNIEIEQYRNSGIQNEKITVVPNGIDVESFNTLPKKGVFRQRFGLSAKHIILYFGRLNERKGIDFLIRSFAELKKEIDDVILILAGSDDGFLDKAKSLVDDLNLNDHVIFIGFINEADKLGVFVDADVLVYPSFLEIFGLVPFEAIMCGTPVIVTDDCGCGELVRDANCGYLIKYGDEIDLKNKLKFIIENPNFGKILAMNGQRYIFKNLTWEQIVNKMENCYENSIHNI